MDSSHSRFDFLLLFRGSDWDRDLSPKQLQNVVADWAAWFERLLKDGRAIAGHPLECNGKIVSGKDGRIVTDGPFTESKEAVGGYFYLRVADLDEAVSIAKECPGLEYGVQVEVRPVAEICKVRAHSIEQSIDSGGLTEAPR